MLHGSSVMSDFSVTMSATTTAVAAAATTAAVTAATTVIFWMGRKCQRPFFK